MAIATLVGENGILTQAQNAKERTEIAETKEQARLDIMAWVTNELANGRTGELTDAQVKSIITGKTYVKEVGETSFTIKSGYEITYAELCSSIPGTPGGDETVVGDISGANHPELKEGMIAITFNADGSDSVVEDATKRDWYNYTVQEGLTDTYNEETGEWGTSHWANVKLNGNYYVWIPRYAYKIDKSVTYTTQDGGTSHKIDVIFLDKDNRKADGTEIEGLITDYTEVNDTKNSTTNYILHPAFTFGEETLAGIWVGKYETSGTESTPTVLPNKVSVRELKVSQMFDMAKNVLTSNTQKAELDAHMMKNIEWGAVAYLGQSKYGRNGTEISLNQCSGYITGAGRGVGTTTDNPIYNSTYAVNEETDLPEANQQYNGKIGKLSSTTGNIYGVYDMSGGSHEYVMGFYGIAENTPAIISTGLTADTMPERKYYDLYINKTSADSTNVGDALFETQNWNSDYTCFVDDESVIFFRGSDNVDGRPGGIFSYNNDRWASGWPCWSFRVCLTVK